MDTTVTRLACDNYGRGVLNRKCLTILDSEACLSNTLKSDLRCALYCVVTAEEYTTIKVSYVNLGVLNNDIVACACIYTDDIKVESCCILNKDLRTANKVKVCVIAVKADKVSTCYACSNKLNTVEGKCLVSKHPEHSCAGLYRRINYNSTVLELGSTEVKIIFSKSKSIAVKIDYSSLCNCTLAGK